MRAFSNTQEGLEILCAICLIRSLVEARTAAVAVAPGITAAAVVTLGTTVALAAVIAVAIRNVFAAIPTGIS